MPPPVKPVLVSAAPAPEVQAREFVSADFVGGGSVLEPLRGQSNARYQIPAGAGATVLVILQLITGDGGQGVAVLYGVGRSARVPLAVAFPAGTNPYSWPAFVISGLPFSFYEIEMYANGAANKLRAIAFVGAGHGGAPSIKVNADIGRLPQGAAALVTIPPQVYLANGWIDLMPATGEKGMRFTQLTPDDATDLAVPTDALLLSTSGTVKITDLAGGTNTLTLAGGVIHSIAAKRVWATGLGVGVTVFSVRAWGESF